ncbi:hypothetical protein EST38_g4650 [Candolleomyces aberdarensis]|uniref:Uncharacterized protein n=1 Tax=Candolleomyces aberdarensis TaxID=2316362 RepID=A0A4V1Q485_9AGAR|nr:hypothetical protein EST38_g4650 [Candolleomyces aberdarensis]
MNPPGEQRAKPRKRDRIKKFLKDPLGSRTASPSHSRNTSHPTVAGGTGTSSQAAHDVVVPTPPVENATRSEIQSDQNNINTAIEVIPAQNEGNTFLPSTSTSGHNRAPWLSSPFPPSGLLAMPRGEGEVQGGAAHAEGLIQNDGAAVTEGDPSGLSPPTQSNVPATATSHASNKPRESTAHVEHQPAGLAGKIYEGSVAAGLLVICNTIDAYGENKEEFDALLKRVEVLLRIVACCPSDVPQEVKDRFDELLRTLEEKKKILQDKVDPTRSSVERVMLTTQDKQEVLKLTQEVRFAIEIAMFDAIIENRAQTFRVVSGVDWVKERLNVIEDHTKTMHTIKRTVESLKRSSTFI